MPPARPWFDPEPYAGRLAAAGVGCVFVALAVGDWWLLLAAPGLLLLLAAATSAREGLILFGPLARWELTRTARRSRPHLWRVILLVTTLVLLGLAFSDYERRLAYRPSGKGSSYQPVRPTEALTESVAVTFAAYAVVLGLATALFRLPPVIAEEREANRLEHLLVTDLRHRELLFGKMFARFAVFGHYLLLMLPVLAMLSLLGGLSPDQVFVFAAALAVTLVGVAGIALAHAPRAAKPADAVMQTVFAAVLFLILTGVCEGVGKVVTTPTDIADVLRFFGSGNPIVVGQRVGKAGPLPDPQQALRHYAAVHLLVFAGGFAVAVRGLRRLRDPRPKTIASKQPAAAYPPQLPPVTDDPVTWYDSSTVWMWRVPPSSRFRRYYLPAFKFIAINAVVLTCAAYAIDFAYIRRDLRNVFQLAGGVTFFVVTVPTLWTACRGVARERERDTLEALTLTDLTPTDIIRQKIAAAEAVSRPVLLVLLAAVAVAAVVGIMTVVAAAAVVITTLANHWAAARLGVRVSITEKKQSKAVGRAVGLGFAWYFSVALLSSCFASVAGNANGLLGLAAFPPVPQLLAGAIGNTIESVSTFATLLLALLVYVVVTVLTGLWAERSAASRFETQLRPAPEPQP